MPSLIDHVRAHVADCCRRAGTPAPQFTDAEVLAALVLEGHDFGPLTADLLEAAHDVSGEPRVPAGQPGGGEWTKGGAGGAGGKAARPARRGPTRGRAKRVARLERFANVACAAGSCTG
jgi:hypothetical protein